MADLSLAERLETNAALASTRRPRSRSFIGAERPLNLPQSASESSTEIPFDILESIKAIDEPGILNPGPFEWAKFEPSEETKRQYLAWKIGSNQTDKQEGRRPRLKLRETSRHNMSGQPSSGRRPVMDLYNGSEDPPPRQAPPSPSSMQNGINGTAGIANGMTGLPTPAGHQSDLNYLYQMVESLSGELNEQRRLTGHIIEAAGLLRNRALHSDLTNQEIIDALSPNINESSRNIETENAELRAALANTKEALEWERESVAMCMNTLKSMLAQMHAHKAREVADTCAWHRSYRNQLDIERQENVALRCEIFDKIAAASRGMEALRQARRRIEDSDAIMELRIELIAKRREARTWKRMAMPLLADDDETFSSNSDIADDEDEIRRQERAEMARDASSGVDLVASGSDQ